MTLVFFNVGWMERYEGLQTGDTIVGGGSYVKDEGRGNEVCNFAESGGTLYGYVQPPGWQINIGRLGAQAGDDQVSGVTVVWTATRPTGGTAVVGWYNNATVYRSYQKHKHLPPLLRKNGVDGFWASAASRDGKLLGVDERTCEIPRQVKGGMGQSNVWYADSPESASVVARVKALVTGKRSNQPVAKHSSRASDQDRKVRVERAAVRLCCEHFEKLGYSVRSVERDNVGWDLEATSGKTVLRVEVKGLSGSAFSVELTPNEYRAFSERSEAYRLAVVTEALDKPALSICRYSKEQDKWVVAGQMAGPLEVETKQSATVRCS